MASGGSDNEERPKNGNLSRSERNVAAAEIAAEALFVGVLSSIDWSLGVLGSAVATLRQSKLLPRWLTLVDEELRSANVVLDPDDPQTEAMFNRFTIAAMQTARTEKWKLLAAALSNSGPSSATPDFLVEHFADLVIRFTPEHIRVMQMASAPSEHGIDIDNLDSANLLAAMAGDAAEQDRDDLSMVIEVVWNELVLNDLVDPRFLQKFTQILGAPEERQSTTALSTKGYRFLRHLRASV